MINFRKTFEFLFKSFDISGDTKLIEKLETEGIRFLMLIKRHWIFGVLKSWRVIAVVIIAFINAYILFSDKGNTIISIIIGVFLLLNVFYWVLIICIYLIRFYKIQGNEPHIEDIYSCLKKSKNSDIIFTKFFNQTIFLLLTLILITIFTGFSAVSSLVLGGGVDGFGIGVINIVLLIVQLGLFFGYLQNMMNLEMDFNIIIPGKILFYNQNGLLGTSQSMNAEKIKTMNTKYSGLFGSFFNYGNIIILTEGDKESNGEMMMDYIGNPTKTVKEVQKVISNDIKAIENEVNILLRKLETHIGITNISTPENKRLLKEYVLNNETKLHELYENADEETKREIKELYILIQD
ncbi:MAG: hypothetical protein PHE25_03695 [Candidatus Gracilibacteria bacterium]|nr:hypothetical protein [Candidatus Gracilibacteria bacterium]